MSTAKEIKAKLDTIEQLSSSQEVKTLCQVIAEMVTSVEDKSIGFKSK